VIPHVAHFVWYGREFPWVNALAIRSALDRGGFDRVVLHHEDDLSGTRWWKDLAARPGFEARRIDAADWLARARASGLEETYASLRAPAARANLLRAAILAAEGGLYLDLDTVTVRALAPILDAAGVLCGEERIAFPASVARSMRPSTRLAAIARAGLRGALRIAPGGWRAFRKVEHLYPVAVNNAVLGASAGHPFVRGLLDAAAALPRERRGVRFALGTHLLQDRVRAYRGADLVVHPPPVFYPLPPEISEHWFRRTDSPSLDEVLSDETRVVHWYASVRTQGILPAIDPVYVKRRARDQLFSALAEPFATSW